MPVDLARRLRGTNIKLFVVQVGYGRYANPHLMRRVAEEAGGVYVDSSMFVKDFSRYLADEIRDTIIRDHVEAGVKVPVEVPDYITPFTMLVAIALISLAIAVATEVG